MIETKRSGKSIKLHDERKTAIIQFVVGEYSLLVFQGSISEFDILVKYAKGRGRLRTPKHIHWVVDLLMKMQGNEVLTREFLEKIKEECWNKAKPLPDNSFETLECLVLNDENSIKITQYEKLDQFGEYSVEFLLTLMTLLALQEKTNRPDAYMFVSIIDKMLESKIDIFSILSTAAFRGR